VIPHPTFVFGGEKGDLPEGGDARLMQQLLDHRPDPADVLEVVGAPLLRSRLTGSLPQRGLQGGDAGVSLGQFRPASQAERGEVVGEGFETGVDGGESVGDVLEGRQAAGAFGE